MFTSNSIREQIALFVLSCLFIYVFIVNAWICDDAYITFRVVDNFINGYGLTWNPGERVQVYTHPLWMFLISFLYYCFADVFYTTISISLLLCLLSITLVWQAVRKSQPWLLVLFVLLAVSSKALIDYSSSGLENPLSFFLSILFYAFIYSREERLSGLSAVELAWCFCIASLAFLTRPDTILLYLPALAFLTGANVKAMRYTIIPAIIAGSLPAVIWSSFSLLYYGFLVPNTAYAKIGTGISAFLTIDQGLAYYYYTILYDPVTLIIIFLAIAVLLRKQSLMYIMSASGIILYLLYIVWIGGDFFGGRFFSVPYFLSCYLLLKTVSRKTVYGVLIIVALWALAANPKSPIKSTIHYSGIPSFMRIHDERAFYYPYTGLLTHLQHGEIKQKWYLLGNAAREQKEQVLLFHATGMFGFAAGPKKYIIDDFALSDPLLARLPVKNKEKLWPGHFERKLPDGYVESITCSKNLIKDPFLNLYYDKILNITRGPIFSRTRCMDILYMNMGKFDYLIIAYLENQKKLYNFDKKATSPSQSRIFR
jgi:arabinofuranosyltransferase